jgi:hypothetical protein
MLRTICANLSKLQRDPPIVQAYRDVEAVLLSAEQCLPAKAARRRADVAADPDVQP